MRNFVLLASVLLVCLLSVAAFKSHHAHHGQHKKSSSVQQYTQAALADQITYLPGLTQQPSFNQFSGYLNVDPATNRSIFYWYVESQSNPESDPLIWWSNGGPGCSGLLGLLTEHGPFRLSPGGETIFPYEYSWNTIANVLYVEAPAGVGFSYSMNPNDYTTNDTQTAADNYVAIQQFFLRFPHLTSNEFFISAESYGGHYVPQLAQVIVENNQFSNFKGFLVGNPYTDPIENQIGQVSTMCGHSLASKPTCDAYVAHCITNGQDGQCAAAQAAVVSEAGNLDAYGLDYPVCNANQEQKKLLAHVYANKMRSPHFSKKFAAQLHEINHPTKLGDNDFDNDMPYDPCGMSEEAVYLNRADVKVALHISPYAFPWAGCSTNVNYAPADENTYIEPVYQYLLSSGKNLRLVVMSGDDDSVCGTLGTQSWMFRLFGNQITSPWTQWMYNSELYGSQIGGSVIQFKGISLVTVHSAGHMIPTYQPERGLAVFQQYLAGDFTTTALPSHKQSKKHHSKKSHRGKSNKKQH